MSTRGNDTTDPSQSREDTANQASPAQLSTASQSAAAREQNPTPKSGQAAAPTRKVAKAPGNSSPKAQAGVVPAGAVITVRQILGGWMNYMIQGTPVEQVR